MAPYRQDLTADHEDRYCELFELETKQCYSFRLPSTQYDNLVIQNDKVACIAWDPPATLQAVTWDLKSKQHRQIHLDLGPGLGSVNSLYAVLDYNTVEVIRRSDSVSAMCFTESGIAIHQAVEPGCSTLLCSVAKVELSTNRIIAESSILVDGLEVQIEDLNISMSDIHRTGVAPLSQDVTDNGITSCTYLKLGSQDCYIYLGWAASSLIHSMYSFEHHNPGVALSTSMSCSMRKEHGETAVHFESWHVSGLADSLVSEITDGKSGVELKTRTGSYTFLGNERFLVIWQGTRLHIYCFDKDLVLANEDVTFKEERVQRSQDRALLRATTTFV